MDMHGGWPSHPEGDGGPQSIKCGGGEGLEMSAGFICHGVMDVSLTVHVKCLFQ